MESIRYASAYGDWTAAPDETRPDGSWPVDLPLWETSAERTAREAVESAITGMQATRVRMAGMSERIASVLNGGS